jgi:hypothetical protein
LRIGCRDVDPVDQDMPGLRIVEAQQQLKQGTFASTRRPDDGQRFARFHRQVQRIDRTDQRPRRVAETHRIEPDAALARIGQRDR